MFHANHAQRPKLPNQPTAAPPRKRRWRARVLALFVVCALLVAFRGPLLRSTARLVIYEDEIGPCTTGAFLGRERLFDQLQHLRDSGRIQNVLLMEGMPTRLESLGVRPPYVDFVRSELSKRAIPLHAITVLPGPAGNDWGRARRLQTWLREHPNETIVLPTYQFQTRRRHVILQRVLEPDELDRVKIMACRHAWYDENNWWQVKYGWLDLFDAMARLTFTYVEGEDADVWRLWDDEAYARTLKSQEAR